MILGIVIEYLVHDKANAIGDDQFLEKAPGDEPQAFIDFIAGHLARCLYLGQHVRCPLHRPGNDCREKGHEEREVREAPGVRQFPPIYIEGVADSHERKKGNAQRQDYFQADGVEMDAEGGEQAGQAITEEVKIFEQPQYQQVYGYRRPQPQAFSFLSVISIRLAADFPAGQIVNPGHPGEQAEKPPVPKGI